MPDNTVRKPTTAAAWKKKAHHVITCESGAEVGIKIPDLARLIETGQIPQHLLTAALDAASTTFNDEQKKVTLEDIVQQREFTDKLVQLTVQEPKLSDEEVLDVPFEDKELIVAIALRVRVFDAIGDHIAGLDEVEKYRQFRGIGEFRPSVEGA